MTKSDTGPVFLNVGCGVPRPDRLPAVFDGWREIRLDIDPKVKPTITASLTDMRAVPAASVDAIWSSHNIEHLHAHEVPLALRECHRVLKPDGFALVTLPDLQKVASLVAGDRLEEVVYESPAGPVSAIDMIFGHRLAIARGNPFMTHKTGFTARTLGEHLTAAGFEQADVWSSGYALWAAAYVQKSSVRTLHQRLSSFYPQSQEAKLRASSLA